MASSYTTNYNLDKYVGTDKPNLRDQYNAAMDKIDTALLAANTNATEAKAATLSFQGDLDAVSDAVSAEVSARQTAVSNEATARQNADAALAENIAENTTAINNEVSARQTAVSNEATARQTAVSNEATARQNADAGLQASINLIMGKPLLLVVGDSWVEQSVILQTISQKLQVDIANYGYGGTGWNRTNGNTTNQGNFSQQLAYAASKMSNNDKKRTVGILVIGGVNDLSYHSFNIADTKAAITTGAAALVANRDTYFPKVPIYAAFNTQSYKYQNNPTYTAKMNRIASDFTQDSNVLSGIIPLQNVFYSYLCSPNGFDSTNLHLNDAGAEQYGNAIAQAIDSGYTAEWFFKEVGPRATTHSGITFSYIEYMFKNGYYSICPKVIGFSGVTGGQNGTFNIPQTGGSWMFAIPWIAPNSRWDATQILFADFGASAWMRFSMNDANNNGPSLFVEKPSPSGSTSQNAYNSVRLGSSIIWHD